MKKVSTTTGDGVARAFLKAQAAFFGSYRNALKIEPVSRQLVGIKCKRAAVVKKNLTIQSIAQPALPKVSMVALWLASTENTVQVSKMKEVQQA